MQLSERKYKLQTMELLALQSQMNPHFLFNTLQTIYWKVCSFTGKSNEVNRMIENLSDILRYSLETGEMNVTLEEEIKNTISYIEIQKIRYKDKFDVIWEYDDDIKQLKVVKLLLQPLVENSIYHGIKEKEGKSYIKIKINHSNHWIKIVVIDNGLGITPEKLIKLQEKLNQDQDYSEHIGLFNTNKRLMLTYYGNQFRIKIRSKMGWGTAVYIYIPIL
ncbi:MAG: two-component system, sensor histidine kinase YesM [Clostridiales bacterium]|jgi:two-component system sensor histidine kinase YesM|nr:two-component system, sensor histidine kinase YesM [Clostridiales bacterium]